ncbi:bacillithiol transferase BstA [Aquibacillus koreensis]|uniref:Putative metal-dependent hydrolase NC661_21105 n=1 Tax=Aquibacillus koreensis TaxID=279446 RepID=A0A9X4ALV4_9BACI|nr:bacillithiol transferase BstA [Aquibacillus koreensis]MCT2535313.1 bacillithiol transferase BstA [Aquibacillus koreensis]MDC3422845.1 bacillithiol transferase BstA [Aquibacillus koreensis]
MDHSYPIGKFEFSGEITSSVIKNWISDIEELPRLVRDAVKHLDQNQLDTPYRIGGWTIRQVIHHLADSHMNAYVRFKLALTENNPVIKPYEEAEWAELSDYKLPIDISLTLLDALHARWTSLLHSLQPTDMDKLFTHPDSGEVSVGENIGIYAWHGRHHLAHITSLCGQKGW